MLTFRFQSLNSLELHALLQPTLARSLPANLALGNFEQNSARQDQKNPALRRKVASLLLKQLSYLLLSKLPLAIQNNRVGLSKIFLLPLPQMFLAYTEDNSAFFPCLMSRNKYKVVYYKNEKQSPTKVLKLKAGIQENVRNLKILPWGPNRQIAWKVRKGHLQSFPKALCSVSVQYLRFCQLLLK